jgi:hypothetical protein
MSETTAKSDRGRRVAALLAQIDQIPERIDPFDPLVWDTLGLSK